MYERMTDKEIEFLEFYYDPVAMLENIMPININAPSQWDENTESVTIRPYQFAMLGYDYLYEEDITKTAKQNMQIRKGAGDIYNISARNLGKTFLALVGDELLALLHYGGIESCIGSFDEKHLKEVSEKICNFVEGHKLFKMLQLTGGKKTVGRSPHRVHTRHGHLQIGVNEKVSGKNVGTDFHGKHYQRFSYDEASYMSEEGTEKRIDSGSSLGYVERLFGIPDLRVGSPLGAILSNPKNKAFICRLPQYCIAKDSKVLMSDFTTKNIQDINIGDEIFTVTENKPHKLKKAIVENKIKNGVKNTIEISNGINNLWLTSNHRLLTKMSSMYRSWKSFDQLNIKKHKVYYFRNYINNLNDYYKGLFLGFLECEGSFKRNGREKSIGQKCEKNGLRWLLKKLNISFTEYKDKRDKNFSYFYLSTKNNDYINSIYYDLENNKDIQYGFLAGFVYGDGCISFTKTHKDVSISQKNKCQILEHILKKANVRFSKNKLKFGCFKYNVHKFDIPLYLPLSKKSDKYRNMVNNSSLMAIESDLIKKIDSKKLEVYDLTTSCGSFIANGFLVHNCRDDWDEVQQQKMADQYGGRSSMSYKLNVGGELIEGAYGKFDMERLKKKCYNTHKKIKFFEVDKELFKGLDKFEGLARKEEFDNRISKKIIIDRLPCTQIILSSDIGTSGSPSEIAIFFGDAENKFRYEYQISLFKLIPKEQAQVFNWIYKRLGSCFVSLDCTNMDGATIRQMLIDDYKIPVENLTEYKMNENIEVGFETDEKTGKVKRSRGGQPLMVVKNTKEWAIKCLEDIFYGGNVEIPHDEKFLREFAGFVERYTGNRPSWGSTTTDHLLDSFLLFALCAWENINKISQNKQNKKRVLGII